MVLENDFKQTQIVCVVEPLLNAAPQETSLDCEIMSAEVEFKCETAHKYLKTRSLTKDLAYSVTTYDSIYGSIVCIHKDYYWGHQSVMLMMHDDICVIWSLKKILSLCPFKLAYT